MCECGARETSRWGRAARARLQGAQQQPPARLQPGASWWPRSALLLLWCAHLARQAADKHAPFGGDAAAAGAAAGAVRAVALRRADVDEAAEDVNLAQRLDGGGSRLVRECDERVAFGATGARVRDHLRIVG